MFVDTADETVVEHGGYMDFRLRLFEKKSSQFFPAQAFIVPGVIVAAAVIHQLLHRHLVRGIVVLFFKSKADVQFFQGIGQTEGIGNLPDEFPAQQSFGLI